MSTAIPLEVRSSADGVIIAINYTASFLGTDPPADYAAALERYGTPGAQSGPLQIWMTWRALTRFRDDWMAWQIAEERAAVAATKEVGHVLD